MTKQRLSSLRSEVSAALSGHGHAAVSAAEWDYLRGEGDDWLFAHRDALPSTVLRVRAKQQTVSAGAEGVGEPWVLALSLVKAAAAEREGDVLQFRSEVLQGSLLPMAQVAEWLTRVASSEDTGDVHVVLRVPSSWSVGQALPAEALLVRTEVNALSFLDSGRHLRQQAVTPGGVLDRLRRLAESLSGRYGWRSAQAVMFVLCGVTPLDPVLTVSSPPSMSEAARVTISAHPDVSAERIADAYRRERGRLLGPKARPISNRSAELVVDAETHPDASEHARLRSWNTGHPEDAIVDVRAYRQALRDAYLRLSGESRTKRRL